MKSELISIIIVNWNGKKWLDKCLKSLVVQTYKPLEIIVVDNASIDGSVEFIKKKFPKVKILVNKTNEGFPRGNNKGIARSKGKYIMLLNNDTWVKKDFVSNLFNFYKEHNYSVIAPREKRYDSHKRFRFNTTIDPVASPASYGYTYRKDKLFFLSVCFFCSKEEYKKTLGFDNDYFAYYEDVDWFWRLTLFGKKYCYDEETPVYHAGAGSTGKGVKYKMFLWRNENALQTLLKNYSSLMLAIVLPIYVVQNIIEILFFVILGKFRIALSYIEGWIFNVKYLDRTLKKRHWVQNHRKVSDWEVIKKMYIGPAKLKLLLQYGGVQG